ncbi:MAG TPA: hypothetical protein ENI99_08300 [Sedimenticola sp.]|nr:hypothetical protein [Sedimenticola sp.]
MAQPNIRTTRSTAESPDLDWSQVGETVRMLELAAAQINIALREGDDSVEVLSRSFTAMVGMVDTIAATAESEDCLEHNSVALQTIKQNCDMVRTQMQSAIVAFQFYDRLSQQLTHVTHSLESLGELVSDQSRLFNPSEWKVLQDKIRSRFSMQEEQDMFDALLAGATIEEALRQCREKMALRGDGDSIELF